MISRFTESTKENEVSVTLPWYRANNQPETPPSAEAMANTVTLVRARSTPHAAAATGSSRSAASERPKRDRTSSVVSTRARITNTQTSRSIRSGSKKSKSPIASTGTPYQPSGNTVRLNSVNSSPKASVISAR
jgi:hypothetical protein